MEKQKQLYDKAKVYYRDGDFRNSDFAVYAIQLFHALYPGQRQSADHDVKFSAFKNVLADWFKTSHDFDKDALKREIASRVNKEGWKQHRIIFGVPVKLKPRTPFPFKRSLKINDVIFRRRRWEQVRKLDNKTFEKELIEVHKKERYEELAAKRIIVQRYVFFEAEAWAPREFIAVDKVHDAFALFTACATVTQERFTTVYYYLSSGVKSRKPILNPYLLYVKGNPMTGSYIATGLSLTLPDADLNFTTDERKVRVYKRYLQIMVAPKPTPIEQRIKSVVLEFDKAFQLTDPHLRALSLWRCLELTTRTSSQGTRKQEDIVAIISNYRQDDPWKEQGKIIAASRNRYVHEGEEFTHGTRDHYLVWLQEYVSAALALLMWMRSHRIGKTFHEIDDFFDVYPFTIAALELAAKMLRARKRLKK